MELMKILKKRRFSFALLATQLVLLIMFGVFGKYAPYQDPAINRSVKDNGNSIPYFYPMFQDIHVMIFVGFGFLMTFLKKYGFGSVGYNLFIAALVIQWATLVNAWMGSWFEGSSSGSVYVDVKTLITSDFAAAAVLISFGAVLGKLSRFQLLVMGLVEVIFYAVNEKVLSHKLHVTDVGGSMVIHAFGAYFGLAVSRMLYNDEIAKENEKEGSSYDSDLFAMIGTLFLWLFWPSFNAGLLGPGTQQQRAIINTYFSLSAAVILTFVLSPLLNKKNQISMVHVQNATLAGGVAVGTMADLMLNPSGALVVGVVAGAVSTLGYVYISPRVSRVFKIHDTCGVHNLHGMPALIAGLGGCIAAAIADEKTYGKDLYSIWPSRLSVPSTNTSEAVHGRSAKYQAWMQLAALATTLGISIISGLATGWLIRSIDTLTAEQYYDDASNWVLPEKTQNISATANPTEETAFIEATESPAS